MIVAGKITSKAGLSSFSAPMTGTKYNKLKRRENRLKSLPRNVTDQFFGKNTELLLIDQSHDVVTVGKDQ